MSKGTITVVVTAVVLGLALAGFALYSITTYKRYRVPSESMAPGTGVGTRVALNTRAYDEDHPPAIGDLVIHTPPAGASTNECGEQPPAGQMCAKPKGGPEGVEFIKRVVAGPGDRVALQAGRVVRNGKPMHEPYIAACNPGAFNACDFPMEITIPAGHYLMLGDNRGASDDSRFWGPVPEQWILGRVEDCTLLWALCSPRR